MDSESLEQLTLQAERWADSHQELLSRCFECFQSTTRWPTLDELQLDFAADGREVDVVDIAQTIPPLLGVVDQGRLELNVRGMSAVSAALPLLEIWVALLRSLCVAESNRTITGEMVAVACEGDRIRISCIAMILMSEPWPSHCGEGVGGGTWWVDMSDEVLDLHEARTVADVLKVRGLVQSRPRPTLQ